MPKEELNYRTYQIWIKENHKLYPYFLEMCQAAKNLYNATNFTIRQVYTALTKNKPLQPLQQEVLNLIEQQLPVMNEVQQVAYERKLQRELRKPVSKQKKVKCNLFSMPSKDKPMLTYGFTDALFKSLGKEEYRTLPTQSSQAVIQNVFKNWKSFFQANKVYKQSPVNFTGRPKIPGYQRLDRKEITFSNQDCVVKENKFLKFPLTKQQLNIGKYGCTSGKLKEVRVIPRYGQFVVEVVIDTPISEVVIASNNRYMSIDLGVNNLATIVTNTGHKPVFVQGRHVKATNQYYNKKKAYFTGILRQGKRPNEGPRTSGRLERLYRKRFLKIKDAFHKASYQIIQLAIAENIGTIVVGHNDGWKQEAGMSKQNNQSFCHVPHNMLIRMIEYKAKANGIRVVIQEESYTSKASFLDNDEIPVFGKTKEEPKFSGKRVYRGLYRSKQGVLINADVNGACNILRKAFPNAWTNGIEGLGVFSTPLCQLH